MLYICNKKHKMVITEVRHTGSARVNAVLLLLAMLLLVLFVSKIVKINLWHFSVLR